MASKDSLTAKYDSLSLLVKVIVQIFLGWLIGGIYRIIRYTETKNTVTLVVGILALITGIGNAIIWIVDLVTLVMNGKFTVLVD